MSPFSSQRKFGLGRLGAEESAHRRRGLPRCDGGRRRCRFGAATADTGRRHRRRRGAGGKGGGGERRRRTTAAAENAGGRRLQRLQRALSAIRHFRALLVVLPHKVHLAGVFGEHA